MSNHPVLRESQQRHDSLLTEVGEQFMHLDQQKTIAGHVIYVAVQTIDHHDRDIALFNPTSDLVRKLTWRKDSRITLSDFKNTGGHVSINVQPQSGCSLAKCTL